MKYSWGLLAVKRINFCRMNGKLSVITFTRALLVRSCTKELLNWSIAFSVHCFSICRGAGRPATWKKYSWGCFLCYSLDPRAVPDCPSMGTVYLSHRLVRFLPRTPTVRLNYLLALPQEGQIKNPDICQKGAGICWVLRSHTYILANKVPSLWE